MSNENISQAKATSVYASLYGRYKILFILIFGVLVFGVLWGRYIGFEDRHEESTDNAYVQGDVIQITPQIGGTVVAILADDTDYVKAGSTLVQLDPADAQVALDQAEANLAQAVRQVRTMYANNSTLKVQIDLKESEIVRAQTDLTRAAGDYNRRQLLAGNGAISKEELQHAESQLATAQNALTAAQVGVMTAQKQLASNQAMTEGTNVATHPNVLAGAAKVREAFLNLHRTKLQAPVDGYVAKRTVQMGQRVAAGASLMSLIALQQVWVDANFKEVQLRHIRIGQPVRLTADIYGKRVHYSGKVAGLGAGTGAAFSMLPAQNATGNWIKVVQRVPVRVTLDPEQLMKNPLRIGLSMEVTIDTADQNGKVLADNVRMIAPTVAPSIASSLEEAARAKVESVIAANLGKI
jgi:membrane fusion protein, multidrug efflux system